MRVSAALRLGRIFVAALLTAVAMVSAGGASAGTLDHIRQDKTIRIAYREDAPPFSYKNTIGEPAGFMVDLCRAVAKKLTDQLQLSGLTVLYVPVTAANRFDERHALAARAGRLFDRHICRWRQSHDPGRRPARSAGLGRQEGRGPGRHDNGRGAAEHAKEWRNHRGYRFGQKPCRRGRHARWGHDRGLFRGSGYPDLPRCREQGS